MSDPERWLLDATAKRDDFQGRLLDDVAILATHTERLLKERDKAIMAAVAAGISLRRVGEAAGLSHQAINNICKRPQSQGLNPP